MTEVRDHSYEPIEGRIGPISDETLAAIDKWRGIETQKLGTEATERVVALQSDPIESPDQEQ